ncbi:methylenetetrahydrofolate reductase [NAD(P)H] [Algicella marina]|uniref:Methylenetetrahydrofolate reductase n=1 Tax=Algicella marina TaxID=2683284 RepID=A0A6P1T055_9RHOB|nr:methylenetetrahydrofolate reductase [NAD(P)H] [Algicella marina]QHQ35013.1 methylenetetrahydrofolate reductase [NAD(P)H] [Algicella marina]
MTTFEQPDTSRRSLSFEFFPPQTTEATLRLWRSVERLAPLQPQFVSVTYGAGGTTRDRTKAAIRTIRDRAHLNVAGHLTCVGATREETLEVASEYSAIGVNRIVALRGDPPKGVDNFTPHPDGFSGSVELVGALVERGYDVAVGAYPEPHPEARTADDDINQLKAKVDAGATSAITQFFFDTELFLRFRDRCVAAGIDVPIHPGILPVEDFTRMKRFAGACGTSVPTWMDDAFGRAENEASATLLATAIATDHCDILMREGCDHLHFYTLNKPDLTYDICRALGFATADLMMASGQGAA